MRFIFILAVMVVTFIACTLDIQASNVFHIDVFDQGTGTTYDITCGTDIKYTNDAENKGLVADNKCDFFLTTKDGTYKCSIEVGSDGRPINKQTTIKEACAFDIKKE